MKRLFDIGKDKWMHFTLSLIATVGLFGVFAYFVGLWACLSIVPVMLLGVAKELWDRKHGTCEANDLVADFYGCFTALCLEALIIGAFTI